MYIFFTNMQIKITSIIKETINSIKTNNSSLL